MSEEIVVPGLYASIAAFILSDAGLDSLSGRNCTLDKLFAIGLSSSSE